MHEPVSPPSESGDRGRGARPAAPGVTAVVVAHRPGPWFEDLLVSLRGQDYARLAVLVLAVDDDAGAVDARVRTLLPDAEVRPVAAGTGFGDAVNTIRGESLSPLLLICHDDVSLAPDAVRRLVEEALRSNAGIVGPKFVDWERPEIVRQVGLGADKTGAPVPTVEPDEIDQEQHDAVRDVFMTSAATMLVRADLFDAVGGFDRAISFRGEDLDLCWRAHVAGARVMVAPAAVVRHRGLLEERRPGDDPLRLRRRHQLRAMLANYSVLHLVRVAPQAALVTTVEFLFALVTGRFQRARAVLAAWAWNLRRLPSLIGRRRSLRAARTIGDADLRRFQSSGFAPVTTYLRARRDTSAVGRTRQMIEAVRSGSARGAAVAWGLVVVAYLFGSRHLATRGIPVFGEFTSFGDGPGAAISEFWSGWRDEGLGREAPASIHTLFVGAAGFVTFGHMALLRTIVLVGAPLVGALGLWRALRPFGSTRGQIAGLVAYLANPIAYNAMANGSLAGLTAFAAFPWLWAAFGRAAQQSPFGLFDGGRGPGVPAPSVLREVLTLGLTLAVVVAFVPSVLLVVALGVAAVFLGSLVSGHVLGGGRLLVVTTAATVVALALQLPAALDALDGEWALLAGARSDGVRELSLAEAMRFQTGPVGGDLLGWALVVAAILPLVLGAGARFAWAVRAWLVYLGSVAVAVVAAQGSLPVGLPRPELVLAPGATGLAFATALGVVAFETDLRRFRFGWRQVVPVTMFVALVLAPLPVLVSSFDGRWDAPSRSFAHVIDNLAADDGEVGPGRGRILWLGAPDVVPTRGWELTDGVVYALSEQTETTVLDRWTGSSTPQTRQVAEAIELALERGTSRLGSLLGSMGVRYVAVPQRLAPPPDGSIDRPAPSGLLAMLGEQLDLERIDNVGLVLYRNAAWVPTRAGVEPGATTGDSFLAATVAPLDDATAVLGEGRTHAEASVAAGRDVYVAAAGDGWELTVDGRRALATSAFGWARSFTVDGAGVVDAELNYRTPGRLRLSLIAQLVGWFVVIGAAARLVSVEREGS